MTNLDRETQKTRQRLAKIIGGEAGVQNGVKKKKKKKKYLNAVRARSFMC
jgi:uncharacterized membrane protein